VKVNYTAPTSLKPAPPSLSGLKWLPNRQLQFTLNGGIGLNYVVQASLDMAAWSPVSTNAAPFDFVVDVASNQSIRIYRAPEVPGSSINTQVHFIEVPLVTGKGSSPSDFRREVRQ